MMDEKETRDPEPTVFVVDDDESVRKGLRLLIKSIGLKVESYASAQEFLNAYNPSQPGCLVLDIRMPGMSGLDLQTHLAEQGLLLPVIIVTGHGDVSMAVKAVKMGALDFLEKPFRDQVLLDRVQNAIQIDVENRRKRLELKENKARLTNLTPRELQVMKMVVAGKPNKIIASELGLSQKTVEFHRAHVMSKTGVESLADLVKLSLAVDITNS